METPKEFKEMVRAARTKPSPFKVISVTQRHVLDWNEMLGRKYVTKCPFKIQPIKEIVASSAHSRLLSCRTSYNGAMVSGIVRKPHYQYQHLGNGLFELPAPAYKGPVPIPKAKFNDLMSLIRFCHNPRAAKFFKKLCHD